MRFEGTDTYIATDDLMMAVNAAITLERPLLIKGEPGTGKTLLAVEARGGALGSATLRVAHQIDHQGAARALRIRRRIATAGFPARRREGSTISRNYIVQGHVVGRHSTVRLRIPFC